MFRVPLLVLTLSILTAHSSLDLSLPQRTVLSLSDPALWEAQKRTFGAVAIIVLVEFALILALARVGNRRREAQRQLEARLRFERRLSNLAVSLATTTPDRLEGVLNSALRLIADDIGADAVWLWELGEDGDDWLSPELRAGREAEFSSASELPAGIRARLGTTPDLRCSCLAVPLAAGGVVTGALFWVSYGALARWSAHTDKLRIVGAVVASVLQGKRAEAALERSDRLKGAILDSLPPYVAVLDREGFIISVNHAWTEAEHAGGLPAGRSIEPGSNYLDACTVAARAAVIGATDALHMIEPAVLGPRGGRQIEYGATSRAGALVPHDRSAVRPTRRRPPPTSPGRS